MTTSARLRDLARRTPTDRDRMPIATVGRLGDKNRNHMAAVGSCASAAAMRSRRFPSTATASSFWPGSQLRSSMFGRVTTRADAHPAVAFGCLGVGRHGTRRARRVANGRVARAPGLVRGPGAWAAGSASEKAKCLLTRSACLQVAHVLSTVKQADDSSVPNDSLTMSRSSSAMQPHARADALAPAASSVPHR